MKKNIWLNNKLNTEALFSYKKLETPEQGTTTMNFILINNSRNTWNIINDLTKGNTKQNISRINESNAGNFNEYFSQVGVITHK